MANDPITISSPRQGIAQSSVVGFGDVRNLDIYSEPGVAKLNNKLSKASGSVVVDIPKWIVRNPLVSADFYSLGGSSSGSSGNFYYSSNSCSSWLLVGGNSTSSAHGNGLAVFKDWAAVARDAVLDFYGPLSPAGSTAIYGAITVSTANPMVVACDNVHLLSVDDRVTLWTTGNITSSGAVQFANTGTAYYVSNANYNGDGKAFTLSGTSGGIELSTAGGSVVGTHYFRVWKTGFKTFGSNYQDNLFHPMIVSKLDGKLYGGEKNQVFTLAEVAGQTFNPFSSGTYTWTDLAMTTALPKGYRIKCLAELGNNLMMGTWQGEFATDFPIADIFTWDGSSTSYGQPIQLRDFGCHAMLNTGNALVVLAGVKGTVYKCDGANIYPISKIPVTITSSVFFEWYPGSICWYKDKVFFGSGGSSGALAPQGVWSLEQTGKGNIIVLEHTNSQETDGTSVQVVTSALCPINDNQIAVGYLSDTTKAIDITNSTSYAYTTDYSGGFDTPLYQVGSPQGKRKFTQLGLLFSEKLSTGEGIKIWYRNNLTDSFVVLGTWTSDVAGTTKIGNVSSHFCQASVVGDMVQLRVRFLGTSTTTPNFKSAILT